MDRTPDSIHSPSRSHLRAEGSQPFETTSTYFSPMPTPASQGRGLSAEIGLGISNCRMESLNSHLRVYPPSQYASTISALSNQLVPSNVSYEFPLQVGDLSNESSYEIYGGGPNASESPLSLYSTQALSTSPAYNSPLEFCSSQDAFSNPLSELWAPTPCSEVTTPSEAVAREDDVGGHWARQLISDTRVAVTAPMTPVTNAAYHHKTMVENVGNAYTGQIFAQREGPAVGEPVCRAPSTLDETNRSAPSPSLPSASGLDCPVCGFKFTRRSNCREHQKKHDPAFQKTHSCDQCPKVFGRKADLRRHVDSIHKGIRRHHCQKCDRHFSRPETLVKHSTEGCPPTTSKTNGFARRSHPTQQPENSQSASHKPQKRLCKRQRLMPKH